MIEEQFIKKIDTAIELVNQKRFDEAIKMYDEVLQSSVKNNFIEYAINCAYALGDIYLIKNEFTKSGASYGLATQLGRPYRETNSKINELLLKIDWIMADNQLNHQKSISKASNNSISEDLSTHYMRLIDDATKHSLNKRFEDAEKILSKVLPATMMSGYIKEAINCSYAYGCMYALKNDWENAHLKFKLTVELGENIRKTDTEIETLLSEIEIEILKSKGVSSIPNNTSHQQSMTKNNSSSNEGKGGCYIATMAYGDYNHRQVKSLRLFRDNCLSKSVFGRLFIDIYYLLSPKLVSILKNKKFINTLIRKILDQFIKLLKN